MLRWHRLLCWFMLWAFLSSAAAAGQRQLVRGHPRLYFTAPDLVRLRSLRDQGVHARIAANLKESADWCAQQTPRSRWIPTERDDPQYENLYDRFYAAMHDMAIVEHLAFASALADPRDDPYFEPARAWAVSCARVWRHEAANAPDASKAYAVLRIMKALAVSYDLLFDRLAADDRAELRATLIAVGRAYAVFFSDPKTAGAGYNKHHGSVDAAPFGVMALALLGEVPAASTGLDLAVRKHVDYLLPHALTASGTSEQSSNFWASTLQYRIFFIDALRRVTGRDLFAEFPQALPGRIALAAVAGPHPRGLLYNESDRSVLFGPSYGQLNYWSPVLLFLAREQRQPIYQHLALWDGSLGSLQRTRYITPTRKEELLFSFGGYAFLWYDPSVPDSIDNAVPRAFEFPEPAVNEAYLRASYEPGDICVGFKKGGLVVHAGGRPVLVDQLHVDDVNAPAKAVAKTQVSDDGHTALIRCEGPAAAGLGSQQVRLERPSKLTIRRQTARSMTWWYTGRAERHGDRFTWPDGTTLQVSPGEIQAVQPQGFVETKTHYGGMKFADPKPMVYPVVTVRPDAGVLGITVTTPARGGR